MAWTFLSCCIPLILLVFRPSQGLRSRYSASLSISRVHNATRSTAYECLLYESVPQGGGLLGYFVEVDSTRFNRSGVESEMALRIVSGYTVYGRKNKRTQDSVTGSFEHENHWSRSYIAWKGTTKMMSILSQLLDDSRSHAPMTIA